MSKSCTIRIQDEVNCIITNLSKDDREFFYEKFGIFAPNYFFHPNYKLRRWDGKIRFFSKVGKTFVSLLDQIVPILVKQGYKIKLDDLRKEKKVCPLPIDEDFFSNVADDTGSPWKIRPYQLEMINALLEAGSGVGIAGTGAGKTSVVAAISKSYEIAGNLRSIIIVPDKNLTVQTRLNYTTFGLDVGEYSGDHKELNHQHVISTWQSLMRFPAILQQFQVVVVDECHKVRGDVLQKLLNEHGSHILYRFGVTGTLPKEETDALAVLVSLGKVLYEIKAHELIEQGHLSTINIEIFEMDVDLTERYHEFLENNQPIPRPTYKQFKDSYFPDWASEKAFLQKETERINWISDLIQSKRLDHKGNVLCLVNGIKFGKKLSKLIPDSHFVYGQDEMTVRREIYDLFSNNDDVVVIATVHIASTGLDIKRIFNLVFVDIGRSFIRVIQSIGRGLRKAHDKQHVNVIDIGSDLKYSRRHIRERVAFYKEAKYPYKKQTIAYNKK